MRTYVRVCVCVYYAPEVSFRKVRQAKLRELHSDKGLNSAGPFLFGHKRPVVFRERERERKWRFLSQLLSILLKGANNLFFPFSVSPMAFKMSVLCRLL